MQLEAISASDIETRLFMADVPIYNLTKERATKEIAQRIEKMQSLYEEVMVMAREADIRVNATLQRPEGIQTGHNSSMIADIYWNPSSQYCGVNRVGYDWE